MPKFAVRYFKSETSSIRCELTVEAADEAAAWQRVALHWAGDGDLTEDEVNTEHLGPETSDGTSFAAMEHPLAPFAVTEVL